MNAFFRLTAWIVPLAFAAGCAGGFAPSPASGVAPDTQIGQTRGRRVLAKFVIHVPRKHHGRARFISPSTKSIEIVVDPGAAQTKVDENLTPGSPSCSFGSCSVVVSVVPGKHTFTVSTYDGVLSAGVPTGNLLSQYVGLPFVVRAGSANQVGVVLQGVPKTLTIAAAPDQDVAGSAVSGFQVYGAYKADETTIFPRSFTVVAADADGNLIVGSGAPALSMKSANHGLFSDGLAASSGSNRYVVTPASVTSATPFPTAWVAFTIVATPSNTNAPAVSLVVQMQLMARNGPVVVVTDQVSGIDGRVWAFDESGRTVAAVQNAFDAAGDLGQPTGVTYSPELDWFYVVGETSGEAYEFDSGGNFSFSQHVGTNPLSAYWDSFDNELYIGFAGGPVGLFDLALFPDPSGGNWKELDSGDYPVTPWGITRWGSDIVVADEHNGVYDKYTSGYSNAGKLVSEEGGIAPTAITTLPGGLMYTQRYSTPKVVGENYLNLPTGAFPNLTYPFGIAQDPANGYIYVVDYAALGTTQAVRRYDQEGDEVPLPAGAFTGPHTPLDIAISY